ncbi:MAG: hypothetical protein IH969_06835 [Candidatus Krumholzibacteriota bacterium]|nr:hypothetical protein [Candidatus Krumholzibacteriota bacterium]
MIWFLRPAFLGSRPNIAQLPAIFSELYNGNFEEIAGYLRRLRTISAWSAMYYCMDCASGASPPILVEGGSHQYLELDPPGIARKMVAFLRGETMADTTFIVPFEFAVPEEEEASR